MNQTNMIGNYRWRICALVFFATTINYLDRQVISLLKPFLEEDGLFGTDPAHYESIYANIVICFQVAYASGMLLVGSIIDKFGTKIGYAVSLFGWSLAAIGHAFARGPLGFGIARAALGVPEAGNFPAANKTVAEWFPKKERALATGIYNSGTNVGAIVAPLVVPLIAVVWNWKWAFIITGAIGLIWLFFWEVIYESPEKKLKKGKLSQVEYDHIMSDKDEVIHADGTTGPKLSWVKLLTFRQTWAFFLGKLLTDPIWWFFLFWLPAFLKEQYGLVGTQVSIPLAVVYTMTTVGSIFGGWLPKRFMEKGMDANRARKTSMFIYALFPLTVLSAQYLGDFNMWYAVIIIGIAASAHQAWSANIFTTVSDMFPKRAIASVTGIGGMAGAIGGIMIAKAAGVLFDHFKAMGDIRIGYGIMFVVCALAYIIAWFVMHMLVPKFKKIDID
ncbi:MAG: MFS transporter [Prolixibacteraceae bacterium]|jgi:ACS family hexuronate transporter-like MFS transporter|nr:MFS transporter [Prolixibacteraceae bacterium]